MKSTARDAMADAAQLVLFCDRRYRTSRRSSAMVAIAALDAEASMAALRIKDGREVDFRPVASAAFAAVPLLRG